MILKDKTVIISGASRGIGRAIAVQLAGEGANISFNYMKSGSDAKTLEREIESLGVGVKSVQVDIKDYAAVKSWVDDTGKIFGGIDVIINNAGIVKDRALALMELDDWRDVLNTNLEGTFNLTRAAIVSFMKQKSGHVINISSVSGITGMPRQTNYAASKAGIIGFTKSLAKEVASYNIRVNAVAPGFIETAMLDDLKEEYKKRVLEQIPLKRMGTPKEIAGVVKFLLSEDAAYITGQTLAVDGGLSTV